VVLRFLLDVKCIRDFANDGYAMDLATSTLDLLSFRLLGYALESTKLTAFDLPK